MGPPGFCSVSYNRPTCFISVMAALEKNSSLRQKNAFRMAEDVAIVIIIIIVHKSWPAQLCLLYLELKLLDVPIYLLRRHCRSNIWSEFFS